MKTAITAGLTGQQKDEIVSSFNASARIRERIILLLEGMIDAERKEIRKSDMYDSPNWSLRQADSIGYERGISKAISLLSSKTT